MAVSGANGCGRGPVVALALGLAAACAEEAGPTGGDEGPALPDPAVYEGPADAGPAGAPMNPDGPDGGAPAARPGSQRRSPADPPPCRPAAEVCDAVDNDCDGEVDEIGCACTGEAACYGGPPASRGVGECRDGVRACDGANELFGECTGWIGPARERCNERDDDCDGEVDEGCCAVDPCDEMGRPCDPAADDRCRVRDAGEGDPACDPAEADCGDDPGGPIEDTFVVGEVRESAPVDFVMVVDNSGSMEDTVAQVEANLGAFATRLANAGVDYRFALVSERGTDDDEPDVCIPPPMAGPRCGDTERFLHLDQEIDSHDAFEHVLRCHDRCEDEDRGYGGFLRDGSLLQVIVVSDDESDLPFEEFRAGMAARGRGELVLHAVVGLVDEGCVADVGRQYILGAEQTGGERLHICDHDWGRVLEVILEAVVVRLDATFVLSRRPDPDTIRVFTAAPGRPEEEQIGTWTYDPATNAVTFREGAVPPAGVRVVVRYGAR